MILITVWIANCGLEKDTYASSQWHNNMSGRLVDGLASRDFELRIVTHSDIRDALPEELISRTDVLIVGQAPSNTDWAIEDHPSLQNQIFRGMGLLVFTCDDVEFTAETLMKSCNVGNFRYEGDGNKSHIWHLRPLKPNAKSFSDAAHSEVVSPRCPDDRTDCQFQISHTYKGPDSFIERLTYELSRFLLDAVTTPREHQHQKPGIEQRANQ